MHLIFEGFDNDSIYFWAPIDTTIYVRDTILVASLVLQHLPKPSIPNARYYWAIVACDSAGHKITGSIHNKYFAPEYSLTPK